jgi:hypothetical protein
MSLSLVHSNPLIERSEVRTDRFGYRYLTTRSYCEDLKRDVVILTYITEKLKEVK